MHKSLVVTLPNLISVAYCPCGYVGEHRDGDRGEQNSSIDSLAHFEKALPDNWAREASSLAKILNCPLCKTSMVNNQEEGWAECANHFFEMKDTKRATVLTLKDSYCDESYQLVVDSSWSNSCPVRNCPNELLDRFSNYGDGYDCTCSGGHEFKVESEYYPFTYLSLI